MALSRRAMIIIKSCFYLFRPILIKLNKWETAIYQKLTSIAFKHKMLLEWSSCPTPEFFDHRIDLFYQWRKKRSSFWVERGVFNNLALKREGCLLELGCGDGFNAYHFYSGIAANVIACDFDPSAIKLAKKHNKAPNITYILADIRTNMPHGKFDNIIWDASIEHFKEEEIFSIMTQIKNRLLPEAILSGHTILERADGVKQLEQHEYEFKNQDDLKRFLTPYFKNVIVFETNHPERDNLYFWASDATLPFSSNWEKWTHT